MDKLKEQLAVVAKYSFWIMCGGILIVCLASWWMATGNLAAEQQKQLAAIKQNFDAMTSVRSSNPKHPNPKTAEGMAQLLRTYSVEVMRGWQLQYDQQATVLVWPASFDEEFRGRVDKLRPIEIVPPPPTPIDKDLPIRERQLYRDFIAAEIPTLAKTIGAQWTAVATASGGEGYGGSGSGGYGASRFGGAGMGAMPTTGGLGSGYPGSGGMPGDGSNPAALAEDKSIVIWNPTNQQEILSTHFPFITREEPPSTLDVLYAQEDLWILQNIMDIVRAANMVDGKDATGRHEATVKMIDFVRIGRSAMGLAGRISPVGGALAGGGMEGGYGGAMMSPGGAMGSSTSPGAAMGTGGTADAGSGATAGAMAMPGAPGSMGGQAMVNTDPAFGRYVDEKYQPLDPAKLRAALTSKSPADALLAVAKRMPIRMRFTIDQRRLNRLVAECGNSRLPVEVRQVRINREPAPAGSAGGGYGSGGYSGSSGGYGESGLGSSGSSMSMPGAMSMPGMGGLGMGSSGGSEGGYGSSGYGASGYGSGAMGGLPGSRNRPVGGESSTAAVDQNLVVAELYGIVYVYNPVNMSQLGLEDVTSTAAAPSTEPATGTEVAPAPEVVPATGPATAPAVVPTATPVSAPAEAPVAAGTVPPAAIVPPVGSTP